MRELEAFLDLLYDGQSGWVYSPIKPKGTTDWISEFFYWPGDRTKLVSWIGANAHSSDVYLAPALFREKRAKKEFVLGAQVVWCEFDGIGKDVLGSLPKPAAIVESSSSTHLHVYWRVPFQNGQVIENINRRLTYALEADSSGWDSTQVLRPPGTVNYKYEPPRKTTLLSHNVLAPIIDPVYFDKYPDPPQYIHFEDVDGLPSVEKVLSSHSLPKKALTLFNKTNVEKGLRSSHLMQTAYEFAAAGLDHLELVAILLKVDEEIEKFKGRSDQLVRLSEAASIALDKYGQQQKAPFYSPLQLLELDVEFESYWGKYIPTTGNLMITGAPGVGKSQLAFQLAMSMGLGKQVLNDVPTRVKTAFFSFEMPTMGVKWLLNIQKAAFTPEEMSIINDNIVIYPQGYPMTLVEIEKAIMDHEVKGFFLDSLSTLAEDAMTDEKEVSRILSWDNRVRQGLNVFSCYIHHNRKENGEKRPAKISDIYGSFLFGARFDSILCLWKDPGKAKVKEGTKLIEIKTRYGMEATYDVERTTDLHWKIKAIEAAAITIAPPPPTAKKAEVIPMNKPDLGFGK